ncbi:S1 family peptidase [Acidovorax sp. NCPPB 3576]|uniref:S1 family peptidase n=1 Tax=Acidovorax sp. NCPPB 3576 TaxID=2940488 RepID=UPI002349154C|nr:S1 family peptidase [Acidovorax sp. NCPPB 3576]WCM88251.1 S1 family peptidase [Acidovorax sp. NCPPB 3576]
MISGKRIALAVGLMLSVIAHAQSVGFQRQNEGANQQIFESKDEALGAAGLDKYNTKENQLVFDAMEKRIEVAKRIFGNAYAGTWIEYDEKNKARHVIGVAGDVDATKAKSLADGGINSVASVKYSYAVLEDNQKKIFEYFQNLVGNGEPLVYSVGIDDQINKLLVRGRESDLKYIEFRLRNAGFDLNMIKLEVQEGQIQLTGVVVGGTKIMSSNYASNGRALCTAGFNVIIDAIYPGTITSAHCYAPNTLLNQVYFNLGNMTISGSIKGDLIGDYFADGWPIGLDAIIFGNTNFVHEQPGKILGGTNIYKSVKSLAPLVIGGTVCSYGGVNGWRCGIQKGVNVRHTYNGKTLYFAEATVCGSAGDSGGPVVSGTDNALGIFAGVASGNPAGTCGPIFGGDAQPNAVYQALAPYLAVYSNVQIRTE